MSQPTNDQIIAGLEFIRAEKNYKSGWLYVNAKQLMDDPNIPDLITPIEYEWVITWVAEKQKAYRDSAEIRVPKSLFKKFGQEIGNSSPDAVAAAIQKMMQSHINTCTESRVAAYQDNMASTEEITFEDIPF
jgi:hypothetical protein